MGRRGRGDCNMGGPGGLQEVTYAVPADKCGLVIGKGKKNQKETCFQQIFSPDEPFGLCFVFVVIPFKICMEQSV